MITGRYGELVVLGIQPAVGMHHIVDMGAQQRNPQRNAHGLRRRSPEKIAKVVIAMGQGSFPGGAGDVKCALPDGMLAGPGKVQRAVVGTPAFQEKQAPDEAMAGPVINPYLPEGITDIALGNEFQRSAVRHISGVEHGVGKRNGICGRPKAALDQERTGDAIGQADSPSASVENGHQRSSRFFGGRKRHARTGPGAALHALVSDGYKGAQAVEGVKRPSVGSLLYADAVREGRKAPYPDKHAVGVVLRHGAEPLPHFPLKDIGPGKMQRARRVRPQRPPIPARINQLSAAMMQRKAQLALGLHRQRQTKQQECE